MFIHSYIDICEQMLEAYADASSGSLDKSRVVDAKKVAAARSKLQHMFHPERDLKGLPYCDSASLSTSPNTVTHPLSVSHSGSAHSLTEGTECAPSSVPSLLPYASSSAAFDQLYKSGRDDEEVDMNDQQQQENVSALPTELGKLSKRKFESESSGIDNLATSSKRAHADMSPPPPPPPSESPVIATGTLQKLGSLHSRAKSVPHPVISSVVDEDDVPPPPPDDFPTSASTPLIST
jgi:hypothetical protein